MNTFLRIISSVEPSFSKSLGKKILKFSSKSRSVSDDRIRKKSFNEFISYITTNNMSTKFTLSSRISFSFWFKLDRSKSSGISRLDMVFQYKTISIFLTKKNYSSNFE